MQNTLSAKRKNDAVLRIQYNKTAKEINILNVNHAAEKLLGYRREEIKDHPLNEIMPERISTHIKDFLADDGLEDITSLLRKVMHFEILTKNHETFPASLKVFPMVVDNANAPEYELLMRDLTLMKNLDDLREYLNKESESIDALTGISNADAIFASMQILYEYISSDSHVEASVAFLYIDAIDTIHDRYGVQHADRLLCHVAKILSQTVRSGDVAGYIGDGILAIVLIDCNNVDSRSVFKRINARLRNSPFILGKNSEGRDVELIPTLSIGYKQILSRDVSIDHITEAGVDALDRSLNAGGNYITEA